MALVVLGCTAPAAEARRALDSSGFSEIELEGWVPFSCAEHEAVQGFKAKSPKGTAVRGVVCCGVFKSCTVRF